MTMERRVQDYNNTDNLPRHEYFPMWTDVEAKHDLVRCDVCAQEPKHENYDGRKVHTNV